MNALHGFWHGHITLQLFIQASFNSGVKLESVFGFTRLEIPSHCVKSFLRSHRSE